MVVQDHFCFAEQAAPAPSRIALGQVLEHIAAERVGRIGERGRLRFARHAQVPAPRPRRIDGKARIAEQRSERLQQGRRLFRREAHAIAAGQQGGTVDARAHVCGVRAQPGGTGRVAGIGLPGQRRQRPVVGDQGEVSPQLRARAGGFVTPVGAAQCACRLRREALPAEAFARGQQEGDVRHGLSLRN